jgi:hypothetical protein
VEGVFPKLVALRSLDDAEDPAAVMHARVERWAQTAGSKCGFRAIPYTRSDRIRTPIPTFSYTR